jgi:hypothetical protein
MSRSIFYVTPKDRGVDITPDAPEGMWSMVINNELDGAIDRDALPIIDRIVEEIGENGGVRKAFLKLRRAVKKHGDIILGSEQ